MSTDAIIIDKLSKSFGGKNVLRDISLAIHAGEYAGLVGVNGAGKTTLIKCLLDFCAIDSGNITLFGIDHRQTGARRQLTYLPEKFTPPYYLTGEDFLRYMAELQNMEYDNQAAIEILNSLDLDQSALHRPVREYSKGMGQKLGLSACLLSNQNLMVFDEPMSGLDPKARALFKQKLLALKQRGRTLFYSTHLLEDVEALCERVLILHGGRICFMGSVEECCRAYHADDLESAYLACVGSPVKIDSETSI